MILITEEEHEANRWLMPIARLAIRSVVCVPVARECDQEAKTLRVKELCDAEAALVAAVGQLPAGLVKRAMRGE